MYQFQRREKKKNYTVIFFLFVISQEILKYLYTRECKINYVYLTTFSYVILMIVSF